MTTCILLSAGLSERFGSPKALASLGPGENVIQHLQNTLLQSACKQIIVVLGAFAYQITPSIFIHSRIRVVYNKDYNFGQMSSVKAGCKAVDSTNQGILFFPVDCPMILTSTINKVIGEFKLHRPEILIPTYNGKKGHPPIFDQCLKQKILKLPLNSGLNSLFAQHPPKTIEINDPGIIKSFNTQGEFDKIKKIPD